MSLTTLPNELLLDIWSYIQPLSARNAFLQVHPRLHTLLAPLLYPYALREWGPFPIFWAVKTGRAATTAKLIAEGADVNSSQALFGGTGHPSGGWTPLLFAVTRGHEDVTAVLLASKKVDVNVRNAQGRTPLHMAVVHGREGIVGLLLGREGVEVDARDGAGRTPLIEAAGRGEGGIVQKLLGRGDLDPNLMLGPVRPEVRPEYETYKQGPDRIEFMENWEEYDEACRMRKFGETALSVAVQKGDEGIVRLLLEDERVDANLHDSYGQTPLDWAKKKGYGAIRDILMEHAAKKVMEQS